LKYVTKRNGTRVPFERAKIVKAIKGANQDETILSNRLTEDEIQNIAKLIEVSINNDLRERSVEEIQDMVEQHIMQSGHYSIAKLYMIYRYQHNVRRSLLDSQNMAVIDMVSEEVRTENSNKNPTLLSTQRDYMAGNSSKQLARTYLYPRDIMDMHDKGAIHVHDLDYVSQHMHNCDLVNLEDMLQNGTVITGTQITKPHSFRTACNIATQIIAQVASSQYGGQTINLFHLVPFVEVSRKQIRKQIAADLKATKHELPSSVINELAEYRVAREITDGVQTIQYQLVTLMTTNGQTPFVSVYINLEEAKTDRERKDFAAVIEEVFKQRIKGLPDEKGAWITPAFPKLLYVTNDLNCEEGTPYWSLTQLAVKCMSKRMTPDIISGKIMKQLKNGDTYACMGCRSFLTPDRVKENLANSGTWKKGHNYWGRFNQGVVTVNLPYVACAVDGNLDKFWTALDETLEVCHRALRIRHETLLGTPSDVAPILWQYGALARLKKHEKIDRLLYGGYSTISLGYAGLYETVMRLIGKSHTTEEGNVLGIKIMQRLNDACAKWKAAENIDYSLYGTPLESTTYKFAQALQKSFGIIPEVSDHEYITNSYHVNVREPIDAFTKLTLEAKYQELSPGGAISYIEVPHMDNNLKALETVVKFIHNTILYAEVNTKSDHCDSCGYDGEILVERDESGKYYWKCPSCGCVDHDLLHVARRTCGYIGTQFWNQGRTAEIADRVLHIGG